MIKNILTPFGWAVLLSVLVFILAIALIARADPYFETGVPQTVITEDGPIIYYRVGPGQVHRYDHRYIAPPRGIYIIDDNDCSNCDEPDPTKDPYQMRLKGLGLDD